MEQICIYFKNLFRKPFCNWSENIINEHVKIEYPINDDEIKKILIDAIEKGKHIKVVGSKHSVSPAVVNDSEKNIILISMEKYNVVDGQNCIIDHNNLTVTVNAGWKLGSLYDELNKYNYLLETQTASSAFSIGGICCTPVHGARLGAGTISDSIIAISFIGQDGNKITKNATDNDFDLYRLSAGLFGIITTITFNLIKVNNLHATTTTFFNIFEDGLENGSRINRDILHDYFEEIIHKCKNPINIEYVQCFIDYHNNCMLAIDWKDNKNKHVVKKNYPDVTNIYKVQTSEFIFGNLDKNFRRDDKILNVLNKIARHGITYNIEKNMQEDRDMFWISNATRAIFMSYMIPVYDENSGIYLEKLYLALEYVMDLITKYKKEKKNFNIDLPSDLRFVKSNNKSRLSPIYSEKQIIYASIELVVTGYNIETNSNRITRHNKDINKDFREFFHQVETHWKKLGGVPHWGKAFGFTDPNKDPFDERAIMSLLDDETKEKLIPIIQPLFINDFSQKILAVNQYAISI